MARTIVRRLFVLDGGLLEVEASALVPGQHCGQRVAVPVPMYLLDTERGYILIDAGNNPRVIDDPVGTWGAELAESVRPIMKPENRLEQQLAKLDACPADIRAVIYTHLHNDHAGAARLLTHAPHIVQRNEHRWAHAADHFAAGGYIRGDFVDPAIPWFLAEADLALFPGIQLMATPGHTPGHQSVVLWDVPGCGTIILAGDAIYTRANVELGLPPGVATCAIDAVASMHRLVALAEARDATLLANHDPGLWSLIPKCPEPFTRPADDIRVFWREGLRRLYAEAVSVPGSLFDQET